MAHGRRGGRVGIAHQFVALYFPVMLIREPAVAGMFYPDDASGCLKSVEQFVRRALDPLRRGDSLGDSAPGEHDGRILGGVVPHAGWVCSGAVAARVIQRIAGRHAQELDASGRQPLTVVIFGAIHVPHGLRPSIFPSGAWRTPLGLSAIDGELSDALISQLRLLDPAPQAHRNEHSIEVEVPFIQHLLPHARIVPIMTPAAEGAAELGAAVGEICGAGRANAIFLASTDLTHYGPSYGFTPQGVGSEGLRWARDVNDRRMIDLMLALRAESVVGEAKACQNACGAGAIAATIAACRACGATRADLLEHTTSHEVLSAIRPERPRDAVGYAGLIFTD